MARENLIKPVQYWQVRQTGEIMEVSGSHQPSNEWHRAYRRVRLLSHTESDCVFCEDWHLEEWQSSVSGGFCEEIELAEYRMLKTLYDNPDL